jgi:hypothetical protein
MVGLSQERFFTRVDGLLVLYMTAPFSASNEERTAQKRMQLFVGFDGRDLALWTLAADQQPTRWLRLMYERDRPQARERMDWRRPDFLQRHALYVELYAGYWLMRIVAELPVLPAASAIAAISSALRNHASVMLGLGGWNWAAQFDDDPPAAFAGLSERCVAAATDWSQDAVLGGLRNWVQGKLETIPAILREAPPQVARASQMCGGC